jgi:hypothetical protein
MSARHPCTASWSFADPSRPPLPAPLERTNLRELVARPGRFEHHLMVVARIGDDQLECPTASEPLYFAHENVSDEWVVTLPTGNPMLDAFEPRIFIQDVATGDDESRFQQRNLELVLHPFGHLHWPGKLRPPYASPPVPPGMRQCGLTLVYCACVVTPPEPDRPLRIGEGLEGRGKGDASVPRTHLDLKHEDTGVVARLKHSRLELVIAPETIAPPRGGYVVLLSADAPYCVTDLIYVPAGASLSGHGIHRALLFTSDSVTADPPPPSWREVPPAPFAPLKDGPTLALPVEAGGVHLEEGAPGFVRVRIGDSESEVPRHWAARFFFRWALHGFRLGYLETYEGLYADDRHPRPRIGLRGGAHVEVDRDALLGVVETLYRAIAPAGYSEELLP